MKKNRLYLPLLLLMFFACSKTTPVANPLAIKESGSLLTKVDESKASESEFFVSIEDIQAYVHYRMLLAKSGGIELTVEGIEPLGPEEGLIVCYLINYNSGWEIISADKRMPVLLAESSDGNISPDEIIPPVEAWLESFVQQVCCLNNVTDISELLNKEDLACVESRLNFWRLVSCDKDFLKKERPVTKGQFDPDGYWELVDIVEDTLDYQVVNHLIGTHWSQNEPYNSYCPIISSSTTERASAGCSVIAGGQLALYLHNKDGVPATAPLSAFCDAQIPSPTSYYEASSNDSHMCVSSLSSSAWSLMATDNSYVAKLIAEIGISCSAKYYDDWTGVSPGTIRSSYFSSRGLSGMDYLLIDPGALNTLYNIILSGYPVLGSANSANSSHTFIIDGYRNRHVRITATFAWVPTNPENANYYENQIQINYHPPIDHKLTMNWGWGGSFDNIWYTPDDTWAFYSTGKSFIHIYPAN